MILTDCNHNLKHAAGLELPRRPHARIIRGGRQTGPDALMRNHESAGAILQSCDELKKPTAKFARKKTRGRTTAQDRAARSRTRSAAIHNDLLDGRHAEPFDLKTTHARHPR
jgi:hypothetical protein